MIKAALVIVGALLFLKFYGRQDNSGGN